MTVSPDPSPQPKVDQPLRLRRLLPAGEPATVAEIVEGLGLWDRPTLPAERAGRPRVLLNMVSTADGRASLGGRSAPVSGRADRELFHGLRAPVDAVLVGAGTARVERYGRIVRDDSRRRLRRERGLAEEPLACIVSTSLALGADIPLLGDPSARIAILTSSAASLPASAARVDYVRARRDGLLDLPAALAELGERFSVRTLLCEGGPHLSCQLFAAGLVDELFLSVSPRLAGGEALRILAGPDLEPPVELELLGALESDSHLFLRYGVSARDRVSRETTLSSSLAR
ncbi:MAG TPA: dihydrofolate reductase family protein [Solirubrobacteraceae bacterium]|nr:dihydrofolate reductase family protein [Solirubrobacteraceae bacterium]